MIYPLDYIYSKNLVNYPDAIEKMESIVKDIQEKKRNSTIWFLEHPSIYTAGSSAKEEDLLEKKFSIYQSGRGGKYTYHGPGQRIVYFMINLKELEPEPDIKRFIAKLETSAMLAFKEVGLNTFLKEGMVGIWTTHEGKDYKIAAIGIRVKRWITYHGIAINISPNLENFNGIIPCGISEFGVTSLHELVYDITMQEFDKIFLNHFCTVFNFHLNTIYETK